MSIKNVPLLQWSEQDQQRLLDYILSLSENVVTPVHVVVYGQYIMNTHLRDSSDLDIGLWIEEENLIPDNRPFWLLRLVAPQIVPRLFFDEVLLDVRIHPISDYVNNNVYRVPSMNRTFLLDAYSLTEKKFYPGNPVEMAEFNRLKGVDSDVSPFIVPPNT